MVTVTTTLTPYRFPIVSSFPSFTLSFLPLPPSLLLGLAGPGIFHLVRHA
jgi:hypothetical protein